MRQGVVLAVVLSGVWATLPTAGMAEDKETSCGHQAAVVSALQQARKDRVGERAAQALVLEAPTWPEKYNATVPLIAGWVYGKDIKMRDVRTKDLGAAWKDLCLQQG